MLLISALLGFAVQTQLARRKDNLDAETRFKAKVAELERTAQVQGAAIAAVEAAQHQFRTQLDAQSAQLHKIEIDVTVLLTKAAAQSETLAEMRELLRTAR